MKLLLHICCGPCSIYPILKLQGLKVAFKMYFYNPYIYPYEELEKRIIGAKKVAKRFRAKLEVNNTTLYDEKREKNCSGCYLVRLDTLFIYAKKNNFTHISSTLLGSPFQNHKVILDNMEKLANQYQIKIFTPNFQEGFYYGQKLARENEIYCQKYCGCYNSYLTMQNLLKEDKND